MWNGELEKKTTRAQCRAEPPIHQERLYTGTASKVIHTRGDRVDRKVMRLYMRAHYAIYTATAVVLAGSIRFDYRSDSCYIASERGFHIYMHIGKADD